MRANGNERDLTGTQPKTRRKPGRVPTSCAECRRLKLRCDKKVPCEKCVSRGCGSICPDGSLTPGKGNRLVLANTEELHERIEQLCSRIRELENALRSLQESVSDDPHPLLKAGVFQQQAPQKAPPATTLPSHPVCPTATLPPDPDEAPDSQSATDDDDNFVDAFGTLTLGRRGESTFFGKTARAEYLIRALTQTPSRMSTIPPRLSKRFADLAFPEPEVTDPALGPQVLTMLPSLSEAIRLCEIYQEHGKYLYTPVPRTELLDEILMTVYRADSFENLSCYHSLSLLFVVFAIATLLDPECQPYSAQAQEYFHLARTALSFNSQTTQVSLQALIYFAQYLELSDWDSLGSNSAWMYIGHAVRLGHSIGLHLNSARWRLSDVNIQRRSRLFWQLFMLDTWASFYFGRPPTMSASFIDCPFPQDTGEVAHVDGEKHMSFDSWNWQYSALLHSIMATAFSPKLPKYSVILSLDRKVRDFPVPSPWRPSCETPDAPPAIQREICMKRWLVLSVKESTLLNLHRPYFAQALQENPGDLARHRYIPSVMAIYRSAWRLIEGLRLEWTQTPHPLTRTSLPWSQALSAAVVMCLLVTRAPSSTMASPALVELDSLLDLFEEATKTCRAAANLLDSIRSLHQKAHETMDHPPSQRSSTITPSELDRISGKTHLLAELGSPDSGEYIPSDSVTVTGLSSDDFPDMNTEALHPSIAQDVRSFDIGAPPFNNLFDFPTNTPTHSVMSDIHTIENHFHSTNLHPYQPQTHSQSNTSSIFDQPPPILDSTWQSFVEQLGF